MTSYSTMAANGRAASVETTKGRRKRTATHIEYDEPTGVHARAWATVVGRLVGECGHTLRWLAAVPVVDGEPRPSYYLTSKVGRKMTCQHDDCRIPPKGTP